MTTRIIGIVLLQNEENFVTWAIGNSIDFCDEMIVIDNNSTDATWAQVEALAKVNPKIRMMRDANANRTNVYVQEYIGEDVWVFGIDGDEIYDREGLRRLRERLIAGEFSQYWRVQGNTLHATVLDLDAGMAQGYSTPIAAAATKLYNFALIAEWTPERQRLHGIPVIAEGRAGDKLWMSKDIAWEDSDFRNLHLCFFPRSSIDAEVTIRKNISDKFFKHRWRRSVFQFLTRVGGSRVRAYLSRRSMLIKQRAYMGGEVVGKGIDAGFGRPSRYAAIDANAARTEAMLTAVSDERRSKPDLRSEREIQYGGWARK